MVSDYESIHDASWILPELRMLKLTVGQPVELPLGASVHLNSFAVACTSCKARIVIQQAGRRLRNQKLTGDVIIDGDLLHVAFLRLIAHPRPSRILRGCGESLQSW